MAWRSACAFKARRRGRAARQQRGSDAAGAGLRQLPLNPEIVQVVREKVKGCYHKDFVVDTDHHWLLQGWKGRILYAISTWVANEDDAGSCF